MTATTVAQKSLCEIYLSLNGAKLETPENSEVTQYEAQQKLHELMAPIQDPELRTLAEDIASRTDPGEFGPILARLFKERENARMAIAYA